MTAAPHPIAQDVTVVVPTLGGATLRGCLESIAAGTMWPASVVVVDQGGGPEPGWLPGLRQLGLDVRHLSAAPAGIAAATNLGLRHAHTQFVAVTHDDCLVRRDWLARMAERLARSPESIVTGRVEPEGEGIVLTVKLQDEPATYTSPLLDGDVLFPPNMGFAVRLTSRVGPFDEHPSLATAGEDNEWAHRAMRAGVPIVYDPSVIVGHLARHQVTDLPDLYRRYARGHGAFYGTWLRRGDLLIAARVVRDLLRAPWLIARGLMTRNRQLVSMGRGEMVGLVPGIVAGLRNPGVQGRRHSTRRTTT